MKKTSIIQGIAKQNNLSVVTTFDGKEFITGFDTWQDVEEFCEKHTDFEQTADAVILYHRDGLAWEFKTNTYSPLNSDDEEICRDHNCAVLYDNTTTKEDFFLGEDGEEDNEFLQEVWQAITQLKDNQVVGIHNCDGYEIIECNCLRDRFDVHNWLIAVECSTAREEEIAYFTDNEIVREAERRGCGVEFEGLLDGYIEDISYGNRPNLILDDFISWFKNGVNFVDYTEEEAIEAGTWYWEYFLENYDYTSCNTGDTTPYIDFIASHEIIEHEDYRILCEGFDIYHLYQIIDGVEKKIGDYKGRLKLKNIDADINTILESLNK
jgi:hypothetical protein